MGPSWVPWSPNTSSALSLSLSLSLSLFLAHLFVTGSRVHTEQLRAVHKNGISPHHIVIKLQDPAVGAAAILSLIVALVFRMLYLIKKR